MDWKDWAIILLIILCFFFFLEAINIIDLIPELANGWP